MSLRKVGNRMVHLIPGTCQYALDGTSVWYRPVVGLWFS